MWVLAAVTVLAIAWECGVTPQWEGHMMGEVEATRRLSPSPALLRSSTLGPIRIFAYYGDMSDLTSTLITRIQTVIMPSMVNFYARTLSIYPLAQNWTTTQTTCGTHPIPVSHQTTGLSNVDLVLYVSTTRDIFSSYVARAMACAFDGGNSQGSPIAGMVEVNAAYYYDLEVGEEIQVFRHEVAHVLGFSGYSFPLYRKSNGTDPVISATARGHLVAQLTTPAVLARARAVFNCSTLTGVELENFGGSGTAGSHWEKRIMMNDFMTGAIMPDAIYSDITFAAFEDSGWYTVNYNYMDKITFGANRGCDFVNINCVVNGVAQFPEFCAATNTSICSDFNTKKSLCNIESYLTALPTEDQYFLDPKKGGMDSMADYCPYVMAYSNGDCTGMSVTPPFLSATYGEQACPTCRCFTGTYIKTAYSFSFGNANHSGCHQVTCANGVASVLIGTTTILCPAAGGQVSSIAGYGGYITCPPYSQICGKTFCPSSCYGNGQCANGLCVCYDGFAGLDCSLACDPSCKSCAGAGASQCSSCYAKAVLSGAAPSACQCESGAVPLPTVANCDVCHPTCNSCASTDASKCLSCYPHAIGRNDTFPTACVCAPGFYPNPSPANCSACDSACSLCTGPDRLHCLACTYPYVLFSNTCGKMCPYGQTAANGVCQVLYFPQITITNRHTNFAPIGIVSGVVLFGLLSSLLFSLLDCFKYKEVGRVEKIACDTSVPLPAQDITNASLDENRVKPKLWTLLLESHCLTGLVWHSPTLYRWMKTATLTCTLAVEMACIGGRYEWKGESSSVWKYDYQDCLYCLGVLGVGMAVGLLLSALFTIANKAKQTVKRVLQVTSVLLVTLLTGIAAAGAIYMTLDLDYESGGHWALSCLPTLGGELLICQPWKALARAGLLRLLG